MVGNSSIGRSLAILAAGVALPLMALAAFTIATEYTASVRRAEGQADRLAAGVAAAVAQYYQDAYRVGEGLAESPAVRSLDPRAIRARLDPVVAALPAVPNLVVTDREGRIIYSALEVPEPAPTAADREWFRAVVGEGRPVTSPPLRGRVSQELVTVLTYPVRNGAGEIAGALFMPLRLGHLQELVARSATPDALLTITDTAFVVLARSSDVDEWLLRRLPASPPEDKTDLSLGAGFNEATAADGVRRLFAFRRVPGTPWVVWAGLPTRQILATVRATLAPKLLLSLLVVLFVAVFAHRTAHTIQASLRRLVDHMRAGDDGRIEHLPEDGPLEVAEVARSFNRVLAARRMAEEEVARRAELHQLLMKATNDAVWDWDLRHDRITGNDGFVELFGPPPRGEGSVLEYWLARVHPEDAEAMRRRFERMHQSHDDAWSAEYRVRDESGEWREVLDRCYLIRDEDGRPARVVGAIMDVTETRRAQARYEAIFQNSAFPIYLVSADGEILEANEAFHQLMELPEGAAKGLNEQAFHVDPDALRAQMVAAMEGAAEPAELEWRTRSGGVAHVRVHRTRLQAETAGAAYEVIAEDLTERKTLEEQFRQSQKMEAVGRLAGGVAHDFNNRLTVIQGRAQLLRAELEHDPELLENVDAILDSAEAAARMTRELLALSRKRISEPRVLSVNDLIAKLRPTLQTLLEESLVLVTELQQDLPSVRVDPGHFEQMLMNLVVNARDAQEGSGTITIRTARRLVTPHDAEGAPGLNAGAYVSVTVADTGTGMPPEVLARAFEPFFTTKPVGVGTGLGLSTVYGLAKQNHVYVQIRSEVGQGTEVELLFPEVLAESERVLAAEAVDVPRGGGALVLVVEDEEGVRQVVARTLDYLGYQVVEAASGEDALDLPSDILARLDLLVTDVIMPGMRGDELAERLRQIRADLPILFMSGYRADIELGQDATARRFFIPKPFTPPELGLAVAEALASAMV